MDPSKHLDTRFTYQAINRRQQLKLPHSPNGSRSSPVETTVPSSTTVQRRIYPSPPPTMMLSELPSPVKREFPYSSSSRQNEGRSFDQYIIPETETHQHIDVHVNNTDTNQYESQPRYGEAFSSYFEASESPRNKHGIHRFEANAEESSASPAFSNQSYYPTTVTKQFEVVNYTHKGHEKEAHSGYSRSKGYSNNQIHQNVELNQPSSNSFLEAHRITTRKRRRSAITAEEAAIEDANRQARINKRRPWTAKEDAELKSAVEKYQGTNWKAIAEMVPTRTHVQCLQRWRKSLHPGVIKGRWTPEEDECLLRIVNENRHIKNWGHAARFIPGRTAKQCRERYTNHLDPDIKKGDWTITEDSLIAEGHKRLGNKWAEIASHLPGRTENSVKIRAKCIRRKELKRQRQLEKVRQKELTKQRKQRFVN